MTIEQSFEALLNLVQELDEEESRAIREGLDEESLALFDLLKKPDLIAPTINRIKKVAVELLETFKGRKAQDRPLARQGIDPRRDTDRHSGFFVE